jgi:hypothetical protein
MQYSRLRSCAATNGGQGKLKNCVYFPWLPAEAALSIITLAFLLEANFFEK